MNATVLSRPTRSVAATSAMGAGFSVATSRYQGRVRSVRTVLLAGAALTGGAFLLAGVGDVRPSASAPDAVPDTTEPDVPYKSAPSRLGPAPSSLSPSADAKSASPRPPATISATDDGTRAPTKAQPSATAASDASDAADAGSARTGSGGSDDGPSCTRGAGSGPITGYSACVSSGTVTLRTTFNASQRYYHAFIDTDGDTSTGYQLPYPSPSALGADYMIENGVLYRSLSTDWSWTEAATDPRTTVSGSTHTWTLPLSGIGSPTGTQRVEFHAGTDYTRVIAFNPK